MKTIGIIPARMAASRFPGKPLFPISGRPMIEHCFERAKLYKKWDGLFLATCDNEIKHFAESREYPVIMTSNTHTRALDRVAEAAEKCPISLTDNDIVVCVQGDEPLIGPDIIEAVIVPFDGNSKIEGTMLTMPIHEEELMSNPDIVKVVHDQGGDVLYTSRSSIPYYKPGTFSAELGAKRVGGVFGFRWYFLKWFTQTPESPLERIEACDSNRICDNGRRQRMALVPHRAYISVDSPVDIQRVETALKKDIYWGKY